MRKSPLLSSFANIDHGFTTKEDAPETQEKIRASTANAKQVHKDSLRWITSFEKAAVEADAIGTSEKNLPVGVYTADCAPILLLALSTENKPVAVMAVHGGWRSTALQIAAKALRLLTEKARMQGTLQKIIATIGPTISYKAFEVGAELVEAFPGSEANGIAKFLRLEEGRKKFLFNLPGENARQLKETAQQLGITLELEELPDCTFFDEKLYHSYRRNKEKAGRILSYISIR